MDDFDSFFDTANEPKKAPKFPFSLFYSQGIKALRLQNFYQAIGYFTEALEKEPNDGKSLMYRCKARMGVLQFAEAKADAEAAVEQLPQSAEAYHLKAQADFMMLDLENGVITSDSGRNVRPRNRELRPWQNLCEQALSNSMEGTTKTAMDSKDIENLKRTGKEGYKLKHKTVTSELFSYERFADDKKLFEDLLSDQDASSVHRFCREGLQYIHHNLVVGSMLSPIFDRKRQPPSFRKQVAKQSSVLRYLQSILRRCEMYLNAEGSMEQCFGEVSRLLEIIDSRKELTPSQKSQLEVDAFHVLALAHEKQNQQLRCITMMEAEVGAAQSSGAVDKELVALHSLGERYLQKCKISMTVKCSARILSCLACEKVQLTPDTPDGVREAVAWAKRINGQIRRNIRENVIGTAVYILERMHERVRFEDIPEMPDEVDIELVSETDTHVSDSQISVSDCSSFKESDM